MSQSHCSYSALGLGSSGTDRIVGLVAELGRNAEGPAALHGAKITGGGSGGTVCIIGESSEAGHLAVAQVLSRYRAESGQSVACFQGSSMGAMQFGHVRIKISSASQ
jgi:L-arabinokinase